MAAPEAIWISLRDVERPSRRTLDATLSVRFPAAFRALARFASRLPPRWRLRQAVLRRAVLQSMGAWARGDFELALTRYLPDAVISVEVRSGTTLDFEPSYRGRAGARALMGTFQDAFGELSFEPQWLVDLGDDVLVMLLRHRHRGRASGVEVEQVSAHRLRLRNGLVAREDMHAAAGHDWEAVVRAVGLDPADLSETPR